jgi:hypothetical protein
MSFADLILTCQAIFIFSTPWRKVMHPSRKSAVLDMRKLLITKLNQLHGAELYLRSFHLSTYSRISEHFTQSEGYRVQKRLQPGPILSQINPVHTTPCRISLKDVLILSSHLRLSRSHQNPICTSLLPTLATCPPYHPPWQLYLAKSTSYEAPVSAVLSNLLSLHPSSVQIVSPHCSQTPSVYVLLLMPETKFHTHTEPQAKLLVFIQ